MAKSDRSSVVYILKIIAFVILFVFIGNVISALWRYIGDSTQSVLYSDSVEVPYTVVIDAGHGGRDGGAVALSALPEKELNLKLSLSLAEMLRACGVNVILTRDGDYMLSCDEGNTNKSRDLAARRKIVQAQARALLVSIHMNSFPRSEYKGLQVYYSENDPLSQVFADTVQSNAKVHLQRSNNRQTKPGREIYLLENTECPAILVECGFLTNPEEAELLNTEQYRQKIALLLCVSV